jgi:hypothetical protein
MEEMAQCMSVCVHGNNGKNGSESPRMTFFPNITTCPKSDIFPHEVA